MLLAIPTKASTHLHLCAYASCWWVFLFTVFYLSDYITKFITVDGEEIRLIIADAAAAVEQLYKEFKEGRGIQADVS